jgi:hypothetical protein
MKTTAPERNTNSAYVISPCYRLVLPPEPARRDEGPEDRRTDTPRGSAVRRPSLPRE